MGKKFPEKYQNETFPIFSVYYHAVEIKLPSLSEVPKQWVVFNAYVHFASFRRKMGIWAWNTFQWMYFNAYVLGQDTFEAHISCEVHSKHT